MTLSIVSRLDLIFDISFIKTSPEPVKGTTVFTPLLLDFVPVKTKLLISSPVARSITSLVAVKG